MRPNPDFASHMRCAPRRGIALVFTVMILVVLMGFAALTIDVGYMYSVRADLQNAADAAALTAASAYFTDVGVEARHSQSMGDRKKLEKLAYDRASELADRNASLGTGSTVFQKKDLLLGHLDLTSAESTLDTGCDNDELNAVYVLARRDSKSPNGAVALFFAQIFGYTQTDITASAIAAFDDRVQAVSGPPLIPYTISKNLFDQQIRTGPDQYSFDEDDESVNKKPDGVKEIHLFPVNYGGGNEGYLNVGPDNQSITDIGKQVENNIPPEHLEMTFGSPDFEFTDDSGAAKSYKVGGSPGTKAALEDAIKSRMGEIVGIFIHDAVSGNGANLKYNVVGIRFVRVMAINLQGNPKYFRVQPVIYEKQGLTLNPNAPGQDGLIGQIILAR